MRNINFSICFMFLCCSFNTQGQDDKIFTATKYKVGVYRTMEEYLNNSPSIKDSFRVNVLDSLRDMYDFNFISRKRINKHAIFGICDGTYVYLAGPWGDGLFMLSVAGRYPLLIYHHKITSFKSDFGVIVDDGPTYIRLIKRSRKKIVKEFLLKKDPELASEFDKLNDDEVEQQYGEYLYKVNVNYKANYLLGNRK